MIGLKISRRWALGLAGLAVVATGLFAFAAPGKAAGTGTIEGGKFVVDVKGTKTTVDSKNSKISISPEAKGANVSISKGHVKITNVPTGNYNVTLTFKFTKDLCDKNILTEIAGAISPPLGIFCAATGVGDTYYGLTKTWSVVVNDGQTTFLEGTDANGEKNLGNAIQTTANGNPVVDCSGKGIIMSFVICPMIENILGVIDWVVDNFIQPYLAVNPLTTTDSGGGESQIYQIWNNIRNFANIIFIGVFFVIVFSQATSIGITNYGIKRLLPRLVLIVIGTNVSFFICAFLVDIFNILGAGVASLLVTGILNGSPTITVGSDMFNLLFAAGPVGGMASLFAQGAMSAAIIFGMFAFLIIGACILFLAAIVILLRQIMLIFLIIASPLAFVAGLLPNTQKLFTQWFSWFSRLLAMYPIIMALFAASKIASTILSKIGQ